VGKSGFIKLRKTETGLLIAFGFRSSGRTWVLVVWPLMIEIGWGYP